MLPRLLRVRAQQGNSRVNLSRGTSAPVLRNTALNRADKRPGIPEWKSCAAIPESDASEDVRGSFHKEAPT